jgi:hypothetical protein
MFTRSPARHIRNRAVHAAAGTWAGNGKRRVAPAFPGQEVTHKLLPLVPGIDSQPLRRSRSPRVHGENPANFTLREGNIPPPRAVITQGR